MLIVVMMGKWSELPTISDCSVLDTVVISGEGVCCSVVWNSGWCVCV